MKYLIYFLSIVVLVGLGNGVFVGLPIAHARPNLLLIFLLLLCLRKEEERPLYFAAFLAGLFLDFSTGMFFGGFTFAFVAMTLVLNLALQRILVFELSWKYALAGLLGCMLMVDVLLFVYNLLAARLGFVQYGLEAAVLRRQFVPEFLYNLILLYPMYYLVYRLQEFIRKAEEKNRRVV